MQRTKQEVLSLRRENSTLDAECHEKEKRINQLQTKVAVLEQEIKDKDQLVLRTKEAFDTIQEQKVVLEENGEKNQVQLGKLEATIKSLSAELLKANEIIKKLQGDLKTLMGKLKLKNTVTIQQEKLLAEKEEKLQKEQKELQDVEQSLRIKEQEVCKLQEQLEATVKKLEESKQLLKNNEKLITWLNKELNENQLVRKQDVLGPSTTTPAHSSSNTIRSGISPNLNVVDGRLTYPTCGIGYPVSSAFAFQNTFPHSISAKNTSHPGSGTKVFATVSFSSSYLDNSPAFLNVVETNPFKHLTHLSLKLLPGNDVEIKKFLAGCLKCSKEEKLSLMQSLDDATRQLDFTQKTLAEKNQELDKLRNEWASHTAALTNKHSQELTNEKEKALQARDRKSVV